MSKKDRHDRFMVIKTGGYETLSQFLTHCAWEELITALEDRTRKDPGNRESHNHGSPHSMGSILLLVAGLEAWLNESIPHIFVADQSARRLALRPITQKYYEIPRKANNAEIKTNPHLKTVVDLRNEIAHYLPSYQSVGEEEVPRRFRYLQVGGLLITSPSGDGDYNFIWKLQSYRLAYWAWTVVSRSVVRFVEALGAKGETIKGTLRNFQDFQRICPPEKLAEFDQNPTIISRQQEITGIIGAFLQEAHREQNC